MTASIAANTLRLNSICVNEKIPIINKTSCNNANIAPIENLYSKT